MIVTDNVKETQFTAGEALQFCHECKPSEVTATQQQMSPIKQQHMSPASEAAVMDNFSVYD